MLITKLGDVVFKQLGLWLTTNAGATWFIKNVASRLDPLLFKATNGRLMSIGVPTMPMLTLTTRGRRSGLPRSVQLAAVPDGDQYLIVASAMGQEKHPDWYYNLVAHPEAEVQMPGECFQVRADLLDDEAKAAVWSKIRAATSQIEVYETRTDRNIGVFRLARDAP